jgi:hypothetical protein
VTISELFCCNAADCAAYFATKKAIRAFARGDFEE